MLRQTAKEIKATFILPDGKYIANSLILKQKMHCTQPQPMEVSLLLTSIPQAQAFAFPFAFLAFWSAFFLSALCFFESSVKKALLSCLDISEGSIVTKLGQCASESRSCNKIILWDKTNFRWRCRCIQGSVPTLRQRNVQLALINHIRKNVKVQQSPTFMVFWRTSGSISDLPSGTSRRYCKSKKEIEWNWRTHMSLEEFSFVFK